MTKQTDASPLGLAPEEERLLNEARDAFKNAKPEMTSRGGPKDELAGCGGDWNNRRSAACSRHAHMGRLGALRLLFPQHLPESFFCNSRNITFG